MGPTPYQLLNRKLWFVFSQVPLKIIATRPIRVHLSSIPRHLITAVFSLPSLAEHRGIPPRTSISTELIDRIERRPRNSSQNTTLPLSNPSSSSAAGAKASLLHPRGRSARWRSAPAPSARAPRPSRAGWGSVDPGYLHQRHLRAESQEYLLRLGGVRVVTVLVKPLLEGPCHVLQGLSLVPHLPAGLPGPGAAGEKPGERRCLGPPPASLAPGRKPPQGTQGTQPGRAPPPHPARPDVGAREPQNFWTRKSFLWPLSWKRPGCRPGSCGREGP